MRDGFRFILHEILDDHIDLPQTSHYYALMRLKAIFLLAILFGLSACSHLKKPPSKDGETTVHSPQHPPDAAPTLENQTAQTPPEPRAIDDIDLLERIRRGFRFPEIKSPHVTTYQNWSLEHPTYLVDMLARAEPFLYYIVQQIERRGLPTELALLPAIESAYKPGATSKSGAAGLWQFIPSTGKSYGLRQDWWYDGRRDAISATNAALDYLTELNDLFDGDWFLTLAAYNAGQGTIARAIKANKRTHKSTAYQNLKLRKETQRYVPKLQALKNIIAQPERYNVTLTHIANQPHFETIELSRQIDLQAFAEQANLGIATIRHLNAGYLQWATPPTGPHRLLLPLSNRAQSLLALDSITNSPAIKYQRHLIASGETLDRIAQRYGVTVSALTTSNNLPDSSIRAGNTLMIPLADNSIIDNTARQFPNSHNRQFIHQTDSPQRKLIHHVVKGDTLWSISRRYRVDVQQLMAWNQLAVDQILKLNQALLIFSN